MAKSKCFLCNKRLRGGEGTLRQFPDGQVHKVCFDIRGCKMRQRQRAVEVPKLDPAQEAKALEDDGADHAVCENYIKSSRPFFILMAAGLVLLVLMLMHIYFYG